MMDNDWEGNCFFVKGWQHCCGEAQSGTEWLPCPKGREGRIQRVLRWLLHKPCLGSFIKMELQR